jgi:hypothetical protein
MAEHYKQKGWVPFSTFAFVPEIPQRINFLEHLLAYVGQDEDLTIPWGIYGNKSLEKCAYYAAHYARARKRLSVQLTVWYYLEDVGRASTRLSRSIQECSGFLHTGRIASNLRDEMREDLLRLAAQSRPPEQAQRLAALDGAQMMMSDPKLVRDYLRSQKDLLVLVHPVRQLLDPHEDTGIQLASFKLKRDRVKLVEARYFNELIVEI